MSPRPTDARPRPRPGSGPCCVPGRAVRSPVAPLAAPARGDGHRRAERARRRLGRLHGDPPDHRRAGAEPRRRLGRRGAHRDRDGARATRVGRRQRLRPRHAAAAARGEPRRPRRGQGLRGRGARAGRRRRHHRRRTHHARPSTRPASRSPCGRTVEDSGDDGASPGPSPGSATPATSETTGSTDQPGVAVGSTVVLPSDGGTYALYYLFPMGEEQQTLLLLRQVLLTAGVAAPAARRRRGRARDPAGDHPGPAGPPRGRADRVRAARGADARRRRGRHRPAGDVVQPDGRGAAVADPQAGGALPRAAHLRLRRLPRAAHPADHRADGRRRAARRPASPSTRSRRVRPSCCRPSSTGSRTCSADLLEISRFDAGAAVLDLEDTNLGDVVHRVVGSRRADGAAARGAGDGASTTACSWPRSTYAGSSGSCATW